jgi:anti-sigma-K factor RskA
MMRDRSMQEHLSIVGMLPDFVLGKLDETSLRRVAKHLEHCPTCNEEGANAMDVLGALAEVPPPPACLRGEILRRAAVADPTPQRDSSNAGEAADGQEVGRVISLRLGPDAAKPRNAPFGRPLSRRVLLAASAAVLLASTLLGWSYERQHAPVPPISLNDRIEMLMKDPAAAYSLDDSDLPIPARGVVFAAPTGREVYLVADGLPALPPDRLYQVWLFTKGNQVVSPGMVSPGTNGEVRALLETPDPFDTYIALSLTAEPVSGKHRPTSEEVLGGMFPVESASRPPSIDALETGTS